MFDSVQSPTLDNSVEANTPIRVLLVDDHAVVRQGLKMFLSLDKDIVVIGEAQNGQEACELTAALKPDIVLMDLQAKIRLEIGVSEPFVQPTIDAIVAGARTGEVGDGKIFVMPLDHTVRIRTGERDNNALTAVNADEVMRMTQMEMPVVRAEDL